MKLLPITLLGLLCLGTGCSHTKKLGSIGDLEIHKVSLRGLDGPNITALVTRDTRSGEVRFVDTANGPGIGPALVGAVGNAGGAALNGLSLRPSTTRINNGNNSSGGNSTATGGSGYGSAGASSSSFSDASAYSEASSWSGVIGSAINSCGHGSGCGVCKK